MLLPAGVEETDFQSWREENKDRLVGLLINNRHFARASADLAQKIFDKNKELDVKYAKSAFSMISKQGVLTAYSNEGTDLRRDLEREHLRRFRFLEYALALQKFTEKYQEIRADNRERAEFLLFLCLPFLNEKANLPKTVTGSNTWRILAEEFSLERAVGVLESNHIEESRNKEKYYTNMPPGNYDAFDYLKNVRAATRPYRNWFARDFADKRIFQFIIATSLTILGVIIAYKNLR